MSRNYSIIFNGNRSANRKTSLKMSSCQNLFSTSLAINASVFSTGSLFNIGIVILMLLYYCDLLRLSNTFSTFNNLQDLSINGLL